MNERIAVVGAGQMGGGIAHVAALSGYPVTLIDVAEPMLEKGRGAIASNLERQVKKGTIDAGARDAALSRITTTTRGSISSTGFSRISIGSRLPARSWRRIPARFRSPPSRLERSGRKP
jgi:3-hydroxyacyl-CoA dehydrogenase